MLSDGDTKEKYDNRGCLAENATSHVVRAKDFCWENVRDSERLHAVAQWVQIH
ncbi:hypothetical protein DPMN_143356 [Dreissena polymorpha]|uniref:Uncharacterized protein n=1 Tax=Dreissena polymorpha TaxID=45954 RepID=A0A9D4GG79_DREPO|nr:hypothetical protein DPMN_143356 [Dreissena polymorpha]